MTVTITLPDLANQVRVSPTEDAADIPTGYVAILNPNPPKDTDGRREESGRGVRELQGK